MTDQHPITPPLELLGRYREEAPRCRDGGITREEWIATQAARWGADQELEACVEWLISNHNPIWATALQEGRRPKPKSRAGKALASLEGVALPEDAWQAVHAALKRLQELEALDD